MGELEGRHPVSGAEVAVGGKSQSTRVRRVGRWPRGCALRGMRRLRRGLVRGVSAMGGGLPGVGGDEDLSAGAAAEQLLERGQGLVEGQHAVDDRSQDAVVDEPRDGLQGAAVGLDEQEAIGDAEREGLTAQPVA